MTHSNLDLARECFADVLETADGTSVIAFYDDELDAFAERIRADERASLALPAGMPEPALWLSTQQVEGVKTLPGSYIPFRLKPEGLFQSAMYTAAQVQAMLTAGIAPGWKAVPVEPTPEMLPNAWRAVNRRCDQTVDHEGLRAIYRNMIADAPSAQPSPAAVERKPLGGHEIHIALVSAGLAHHGLTLDREVEIARVIEAAHGITTQQ